MATTRTFQDMLNEYLPNRLLREELVKRDYVLNRVEKDDKWKGGKLIVPFKGSGASSVKFGGLTASSDIAEDKYVRGSIDDYIEVWGSLIFNHRDLMEHNGKIPESTFLKIVPDVVEDFLEYQKQVVSFQLTSGPHFASVVADTDLANGIIEVDRIDRFMLGQKVNLSDDDTAASAFYVISIDVNASTVTLSATRGGAAASLIAYTTAQNAKLYHDGVAAASDTFVSLKSALLSAANGGSANLHGVSKLLYPYLQAININGSTITATNILDKLFDAYKDVKIKARGQANEVLMSFKHLGSVMKLVEVQKGGFKVAPDSMKATEYGWSEIVIMAVTGEMLKFVGIQEMDDDVIMFMDWKGITFRSNGMFKKRKSPEGLEYFEVRNTSGYQYIVDSCLFGELEVRKPGNCAIVYGISY